MGVNQTANNNLAYSLNQPFNLAFLQPIVANRAPTVNDKTDLGRVWVDKPASNAYIVTNVQGNVATWLSIGGGSGSFTSLTVNPGDLNVTAGNINAPAGTVTAANLVATSGAIVANELEITNNDPSSEPAFLTFRKTEGGGPIVSGDSIGDIIFDGSDGSGFVNSAAIECVTSGTIATGRVAGNLNFYTHPDNGGPIKLRAGIDSTGVMTIQAPDAGVGLDILGGGLAVTTGNVSVLAGDVSCSSLFSNTLYADGDEGAASPGVGITNVTNTTQGAGTLAVKSTTANPGNNTGFIKVYVGPLTAYVPYFTNIAP